MKRILEDAEKRMILGYEVTIFVYLYPDGFYAGSWECLSFVGGKNASGHRDKKKSVVIDMNEMNASQWIRGHTSKEEERDTP